MRGKMLDMARSMLGRVRQVRLLLGLCLCGDDGVGRSRKVRVLGVLGDTDGRVREG